MNFHDHITPGEFLLTLALVISAYLSITMCEEYREKAVALGCAIHDPGTGYFKWIDE